MFRLFCSFVVLVASPVFCRPSASCAQDVKAEAVAATAAGAPGEQIADKEVAPPRFILPAEQHVWARFQPGAWREVRITTETFDSQGEVINRSITTQKEVLKSVAEETYAIDVQATVDVVGKRIVGDWKQRVLKLATDKAGEISKMVRLDDVSSTFAGAEVECQSWELRYLDDARQMLDRITYDPKHFPFVIHRETRGIDEENRAQEVEQAVLISAWTVPYMVQGALTTCSCLQTTRHRAKGNSTRVIFVSPAIPGGEVAAWSSDFDSQGQLSRWSTIELVGFGESGRQQSEADTAIPSR